MDDFDCGMDYNDSDSMFEQEYDDSYDYDDEPQDMTDVEADADTLASAGWGTDEDYGYYGEDEYAGGYYDE